MAINRGLIHEQAEFSALQNPWRIDQTTFQPNAHARLNLSHRLNLLVNHLQQRISGCYS